MSVPAAMVPPSGSALTPCAVELPAPCKDIAITRSTTFLLPPETSCRLLPEQRQFTYALTNSGDESENIHIVFSL